MNYPSLKSEVWYHAGLDIILIFHHATFSMLPCLERYDGKKFIVPCPSLISPDREGCKLEYIGKL